MNTFCAQSNAMQGRSVQLQKSEFNESDCSNTTEYQVRIVFSHAFGRNLNKWKKLECEIYSHQYHDISIPTLIEEGSWKRDKWITYTYLL